MKSDVNTSVGPRHAVRHSLRPRVIAFAGASLLMLALAACGVTTTGGTTLGGSQSTPTATTGTINNGGPNAKGCPSNTSIQSATAPALVLTPSTTNREGTVHVGQTVAIQLPNTSSWQLAQNQGTQLKALTPQGALNSTNNSCVWYYQAQATGTATLSYTGRAVCEAGSVCPQFAINMTFTVHVD